MSICEKKSGNTFYILMRERSGQPVKTF